MKIVVVSETYGSTITLKVGDVCEVTEEMWKSNHPAVSVIRPNGSQFWYSKRIFKPLDEIRDEKILSLLNK